MTHIAALTVCLLAAAQPPSAPPAPVQARTEGRIVDQDDPGRTAKVVDLHDTLGPGKAIEVAWDQRSAAPPPARCETG